VLHRDRVKARHPLRPQGPARRPRARDPRARKAPIIGRLLHESGIWLVAPEDKRYGQDILIPKNAIGQRRPRAGGGHRTDRAALDVLAAGGPRHRGARRDRRPRHGDRDRGAQVRGAAPFSPRHWRRPPRCRSDPRRGPQAPHRPDRRAAGHHRRRGRARLRRRGVLRARQGRRANRPTAGACSWPSPTSATTSSRASRWTTMPTSAPPRCTFPRRVIPMLPEKLSNGLCSLNPNEDRLAMVCDMLVDATGEVHAYQFYPAVICSHARFTYTEVAAVLGNTRGPEAAREPNCCRTCCTCTRSTARCSRARRARRDGLRDHRDADRLRRERPHREDRAAHPQRRAPADRGGDARCQRLRGRLHRACQAPRAVPRARRADAREAHAAAELPEGAGPGPAVSDDPQPGNSRPSPRPPRTGPTRADPHHAAALDAAGHLHRHQQRPLRPGLRRLHALHQPDPPLPRSAGAPRHQGAAARQALPPAQRRRRGCRRPKCARAARP
jgi:hypothetical protein